MIFGFFTWLINMFLLWILDDTPVKEVVKEVKPVVKEEHKTIPKRVEYEIKTVDGYTISFPSIDICKNYEVQYTGGAKCVKK